MMAKKKFNLMKFLKMGATLSLALVFVALIGLQTGCKKDAKKLDMSYYALPTSSYTTVTNATPNQTNTSDFIGEEVFKRQYLSVTINLSDSWLYKFYVEKFSFVLDYDIPIKGGLEFEISITNLSRGPKDAVTNLNTSTYTLPCEQRANTPTTYYFKVNDYFINDNNAGNHTTVTFTLKNPEVYTAFVGSDNLHYSISQFAFYGEHKYK